MTVTKPDKRKKKRGERKGKVLTSHKKPCIILLLKTQQSLKS